MVVQTNSAQIAKICPNLHFFEGWSRPTQPKVPRSDQIYNGGVVQTNSTQSAKICPTVHFFGGAGPDQLNPKFKDLSVQICIFGAGGVVVQTKIPEILEYGHSRNFEQNICQVKLWKSLHYVCGY